MTQLDPPPDPAAFAALAKAAGIDLPLKALAWEDATGQAWLGYNDPAYPIEGRVPRTSYAC